VRFNIVIPARYDSSRLPGKPLLEIGGIPMVVRTAMRAGESGAKSVIIATDDQRIVTTAEEYGFEALMTDKNHLSGTDRVLEVAKQKEWANEEIIINVQGDEPLINPELVRLVAQSIHDNNVSYVSACSNFESFDEYLNLNNVKVILDKNQFASRFYREPIVDKKDDWDQNRHYHHIGIYGYTKKLLDKFCSLPISKLENSLKLEQLRALENNISLMILNYEGKNHRGIDTPEDLDFIRKSLENK
jgi:3-deoxy-manno-octulosonate cytidylyltransferase (CMP-KDO synthetase)